MIHLAILQEDVRRPPAHLKVSVAFVRKEAELSFSRMSGFRVQLKVGRGKTKELHLRNAQIPINMHRGIVDLLLHLRLRIHRDALHYGLHSQMDRLASTDECRCTAR